MQVRAKPPEEKKLPVIEKKQPWMPPKPDKRWSFSSRAFNFPRTAFGSASKSKRLPSMQFKRIVPSYVFKSRHATKEQIALQARLRRTLSRQKIKRFKKKMNKIFKEKVNSGKLDVVMSCRVWKILFVTRVVFEGNVKSCVCNPIHD